MATGFSNMSGILKNVSMASVSPKRLTLVMLIALILLGGMGWIMISEKEEYLVQRNFRLLKLWSQDIASKIESSQKVFEFAAKGIMTSFHPDNKNFTLLEDRGERSRFLRTYDSSSVPSEHPDHSDLLKTLSPWSCSPNQEKTPPSDSHSNQWEIIKRQLIQPTFRT